MVKNNENSQVISLKKLNDVDDHDGYEKKLVLKEIKAGPDDGRGVNAKRITYEKRVLESKPVSSCEDSHSLSSHVVRSAIENASDYAADVMGPTLVPAIGLAMVGAPLAGTALAFFALSAASGIVGGVVGGVRGAIEHQDHKVEHVSSVNERKPSFFNHYSDQNASDSPSASREYSIR